MNYDRRPMQSSRSRNLFVINVHSALWSPFEALRMFRQTLTRPLFGDPTVFRILGAKSWMLLLDNPHGQSKRWKSGDSKGELRGCPHWPLTQITLHMIYTVQIFVNKELFQFIKNIIFNYYVNSAKSCDLIQTHRPFSVAFEILLSN